MCLAEEIASLQAVFGGQPLHEVRGKMVTEYRVSIHHLLRCFSWHPIEEGVGISQ